MNRVYLVTSGSYSDFQVDSAWSTQEKAEAEVARLKAGGNSDLEVEEFLLDAGGEEGPFWWVFFRACEWSGTVTRGTAVNAERLFGGQVNTKERFFVGKHHYQVHGNYICVVRGENEAAAIKVAAEKRASLLARYAGESESVGRWEILHGPRRLEEPRAKG